MHFLNYIPIDSHLREKKEKERERDKGEFRKVKSFPNSFIVLFQDEKIIQKKPQRQQQLTRTKTKKRGERFHDSSTHLPTIIHTIDHNMQKYPSEISNVKSKQSFIEPSNIPQKRSQILTLSTIIEDDKMPNNRENEEGNYHKD